eukprot:253284_1
MSENIKNVLDSKRCLLQKVRGNGRFKTTMNGFKDSNYERKNYAFGDAYYYWSQYKHDQMYIKKKLKNWKKEILQNYLDKDEYKETKEKAKILLKTDMAKQTCCTNEKYGLQKGTALKLQYIMAAYIYCCYDKFCNDFSGTFRRLNKNEPLSSMKKRNSKYWWLSKLLRE